MLLDREIRYSQQFLGHKLPCFCNPIYKVVLSIFFAYHRLIDIVIIEVKEMFVLLVKPSSKLEWK